MSSAVHGPAGDPALDRRRRADLLFAELADAAPPERAARLADVAGADADLARLVERLLAALDEPDTEAEPLDRVAAIAGAVAPAAASSRMPELEVPEGARYGAWRIVRPLGRGGMSRVFVAERAEGGFHQRAALKLFHADPGRGGELARRFEQERQLLAALEHPNIARVLDGGVGEDGRPFLVLELVDGAPIDAWCAERELDLHARVELVVAAARAVQHAHRSLVVHRDLKPSNLLVTSGGAVKLLDFGIAKVLAGSDALAGGTLAAPETRTVSRPLTPAYASPEQVRGDPVTTASDVYQLGLLLYELLAGRPAHLFREDSWRELERVVCESEPPRLARGARPGETAARFRVPADLETIVFKALAKEPERRYASAEQLAEDLERFLGDQPVLARPDTVRYRTRKFVERHRAAVVASAAILVLVAGAVVALAALTLRLREERDRVRREALRAEAVSTFVLGLFEATDPDANPLAPPSAFDLLDRGAENVERDLAGEPGVLSQMLSNLASLNLRLSRPEVAETLARRALDVATEGGAGPRARAIAERQLASSLAARGAYAEAEPIFRSAATVLAQPGPPDLERAWVAFGLSDALQMLGRLPEAADWARRAVEEFEAVPGVAAKDLSEAWSSLGLIERDRERFEPAEASTRKALEILVADLGEGDPRTASARNNLAIVLESLGRLPEARAQYETSLALRRRKYGDRHPMLVIATHNLARLTSREGDYTGAVRLGREALALSEEFNGPSHPQTALTRANLGEDERESLHAGAAVDLLARAVADQEAALGPAHTRTRFTRLTLGFALLDAGRVDEAEALRPVAETALATDTTRTRARAALFLGRLAFARGRDAEALAELRRASGFLTPISRVLPTARETRYLLALLDRAAAPSAAADAELAAAREALAGSTPRLRRLATLDLEGARQRPGG